MKLIVRYYQDKSPFIYDSETDKVVADIHGDRSRRDEYAKLFASAPDLLAAAKIGLDACEDAMSESGNMSAYRKDIETIKATIAKAEGGDK